MNLTTPKNWKTVKLGDLVSKVIDNRGKTPPVVDSGFELLEVNAITEKSRFPEYQLVKKFVDEDIFKNWFRTGNIEKDDVIIPTVGTIGNVAISLKDKGSVAQNLIALRFKKENDPMFLYYLLSAPNFKKQIFNLDIGGVQPSVKVPHLLDSEIKIPESLTEQKEIASILGSFDDKIELLRAQNKTLENMAQALFKEWFVDFNFPGAKGKMIDSELGQIPEGWKVESLSEIADFLNGVASQKFPPKNKDESLPVIKIREMKSGVTVDSDRAASDISSEYIVKSGDMLFSWSGSLDIVLWNDQEGVLNQHLFKVTSEKYPKWFYYYWTLYHLPEFKAVAQSKATTMGHIQRHHLDDVKVLIPESNTFEIMNSIMNPLLDKQILNNSEIRTLSRLRDDLLNKIFNI